VTTEVWAAGPPEEVGRSPEPRGAGLVQWPLSRWGEDRVAKCSSGLPVSGTMVPRAAAAEFEGDVSFTGLNQALFPLVGEFDHLGAWRQAKYERLKEGLG
jgi:hypothetical protein